MSWPFSNKSSGPQLLSFNGPVIERGVIHFDSRFAFDESDCNNFSVSQIASILEKRSSFPSSVTPSLPIQSSLLHCDNRVSSPTPPPHPGVPLTTSICPMNHFVRTTDFRNTTKISAASNELTIFYNGSVFVYNNITPEQAKAIISFAANNEPLIALNTKNIDIFQGRVRSVGVHR